MKFIEKIENKTIHKYGFENKKTIFVFKATEILRKIFWEFQKKHLTNK